VGYFAEGVLTHFCAEGPPPPCDSILRALFPSYPKPLPTARSQPASGLRSRQRGHKLAERTASELCLREIQSPTLVPLVARTSYFPPDSTKLRFTEL